MKTFAFMVMILFSGFVWAKAEVGLSAPDFTLKGTDGKTYKLSSFKGKQMVVLEWFNNDCPYVKKHYNAGVMQAAQTKLQGSDLVWFTIASSAKGKQGHLDQASGTKIAADRGIKSKALLLDPGSATARAYEAKTTPHMFVIDKKGLIAYNGAIDSNDSAEAIKLAEYTADASTKKYVEMAVADLRAGKDKVGTPAIDAYGCSIKY